MGERELRRIVQNNSNRTRRNVLKATAVSSIGALAGCLGGGGGGSDGFRPLDAEEVPPGELESGLNVWNWYFNYRDWAVENFGKEFSIQDTNTSSYTSASQWYSKLESGQHDIDNVGTTGVWTKRAMNNDLIEPLPVDIMESWESLPPVVKEPMKNEFQKDGEIYAIPQSLTIYPTLTYNTEVFSEPPNSWDILWDDEYANRMFMWDSSQYACQIAAFYTGQDPFNPEDMKEIEEVLIQQKDNNVTYWSDYNQARGLFISEDVVVGPLLDGQTYKARFGDNAPINYTVPKEGTTYNIDEFAIPSGAPNPRAALTFTDWAVRPENVKYMFLESGYPPPVAQDQLMDLYQPEIESGKLTKKEVEFLIWPDEWDKRLVFNKPISSDVLEEFDSIWTTVKSA